MLEKKKTTHTCNYNDDNLIKIRSATVHTGSDLTRAIKGSNFN